MTKGLLHVIARAIARSNPEYSPTPALPEREGVRVEARLPPPGEQRGHTLHSQ
jgi:hypothetical protein